MLHRSIPRFKHGQEVSVVVCHVLAAHELDHLLIIKVAEDKGCFYEALPFGSFHSVMPKRCLVRE